MTGKNQKGFSIIELLVVVAIILIIAAIAIPNLLRSRMAANEASAVDSIRAINTAAASFNSTYSDGFPGTLAEMGTTGTAAASCKNAEFVDSLLTTGTKSGYIFTFGKGAQKVTTVPKGCTAGFSDGYTISAWPTTKGLTGQSSFCSDATGVIRKDPTGTHPAVAGGLCPTAMAGLQ